jgi:hypothetical protein
MEFSFFYILFLRNKIDNFCFLFTLRQLQECYEYVIADNASNTELRVIVCGYEAGTASACILARLY